MRFTKKRGRHVIKRKNSTLRHRKRSKSHRRSFRKGRYVNLRHSSLRGGKGKKGKSNKKGIKYRNSTPTKTFERFDINK